MKKQSFIFQMKLQEKTKTKTEKQLNELEMGNLPGKKKSEYGREDDPGSWENNDDHTINVYERHRTNKQR